MLLIISLFSVNAIEIWLSAFLLLFLVMIFSAPLSHWIKDVVPRIQKCQCTFKKSHCSPFEVALICHIIFHSVNCQLLFLFCINIFKELKVLVIYLVFNCLFFSKLINSFVYINIGNVFFLVIWIRQSEQFK